MRLVEGHDGNSRPRARTSRRKRVWGNFNSTGSRAIRQSHEYVRQGGAAARQMLIQAAANEWKVPAAECTAANSVITHTASGRNTTYGKVADAAAKIEPPDPKTHQAQGSEGLEDRRQAAQAARHRATSSPASRSIRSTSSCPAC